MIGSGTRAVARLAWRSIGRSRGRSTLIGALVLLPVAAMAAGITLVATFTPTPEQSARLSMGIADYRVDPGRGATIDALVALLPEGTVVEPSTYAADDVLLPGREIGVNVRSANLSGLGEGIVSLIEGRQPGAPTEVAISPALARATGAGIGSSIELRERGQVTVVGLVEDERDVNDRLVLEDLARGWQVLQPGSTLSGDGSWLVDLPANAKGTLPEGDFGCTGEARCQFWAMSREQAYGSSHGASAIVIVLGGVALLESLLVASAAFAVSVRRRQRELGLVAAAGGERRHLAGIVVAEGLLLGGIAAALGIVVGVAGVLAASPWFDELTAQRIAQVVLDPVALVAAAAIGLLACLLAAALPAWSAGRLPVLQALSGRRPPLNPARRILIIGIVLIIAGAALTSLGAGMQVTDGDGSLPVALLLAGSVLGLFGFGACAPWLLERLERLGLPLPPSARIALRDTARARTRSSPIVTAILAAFATTVALSASFASVDATTAANWSPRLRADQLRVYGEGAAWAGEEIARQLNAVGAAPLSWAVGESDEAYVTLKHPDTKQPLEFGSPAIGDAAVLRALGADGGAEALAAGAIVFVAGESNEAARTLDRVTVVVHDIEEREVAALEVSTAFVEIGLERGELAELALISQATAEQMGLTPEPSSPYLIRLPAPATEADIATAAGIAARYSDTFLDVETGPVAFGTMFRIALVVASLLFALSVTAVAVALAETEARPDQRTLFAVGADPAMRRRIAAARAGVLALLAGALAVPAGLMPVWGLLASRDEPLIVPLPEVIAAVVLLPLAGILATLLLVRPIGTWAALREEPA